MDNSKCVVLVPVARHVEPACESGLRRLEELGYEVRRVQGFAQVDFVRSRMASDALRDGFEELMWIDSDIAFEPESIALLRSHGLPVACGIYPQKGPRSLGCHLLPGTREVAFGQLGGLVEILYANGGFLYTQRQVYDDIQEHAGLPLCDERFGRPMVPYFMPMVVPDGSGHWFLSEDFSFCERARQAGHRVMADTSIRLWHFGSYGYGWEDAGGSPARSEYYRFLTTE